MMKKILYYTSRDITEVSSGINKKIFSQIRALEELGCEVEAFYRTGIHNLVRQNTEGKEVVFPLLRRPYKNNTSKYIKKFVEDKYYDGVYIRYPYMDPQFYRLLKTLRRIANKIVVEIPTYPYDKELMDGVENKIVLFLDKIYRNKMYRYVDRVVTFSNDKHIYGIPTIISRNGIDFKSIRLREPREDKGEIRLLAVAELAKWHGYERIYHGLGKYYETKRERKVIMHLVGEGPMLEEYKGIVDKYQIGDYCVFHGKKNGVELDNIYDISDIGIECLANFKKNVVISSSLKSREYGAKGLPFIMSGKSDVFEEEDFVLKVSNDESFINIEKIVEFYDYMYMGKNKREIALNIRERAEKKCSMMEVIKPIFDYF